MATERTREKNINIQSSLKWTLDYLKYRGIENLSLNECFRINELVADYTQLTPNKDYYTHLKKLDDWLNSKIVEQEITK